MFSFKKVRIDHAQAVKFAQYLLGTDLNMALPFVLRIQGQTTITLSREEKQIYVNEFTGQFTA